MKRGENNVESEGSSASSELPETGLVLGDGPHRTFPSTHHSNPKMKAKHRRVEVSRLLMADAKPDAGSADLPIAVSVRRRNFEKAALRDAHADLAYANSLLLL
jgi:hypothetical protein